MKKRSDKKSLMIASAMNTRKGKFALLASMSDPLRGVKIGGLVKPPEFECAECALVFSDCEKIRPGNWKRDCWVPRGSIYIYDERQA
jgi:hypothetical protein